MGKRLRLFLIRDCVFFAALLSVFYLREPFGVVVLLIALSIGAPRFQKAIRETPELQLMEKHIYAACSAVWVIILLALLGRWVLQHPNNSRALAIASAAAIALLLIFLVTVKQVYGSWPPGWLKSEQSKFVFIVASVTLLALACEWLFHLATQTRSAAYNPVPNLLPLFLLLGLMYFVVLRQRKQFFPYVPVSRIALVMSAFAFLFIAVVLIISR